MRLNERGVRGINCSISLSKGEGLPRQEGRKENNGFFFLILLFHERMQHLPNHNEQLKNIICPQICIHTHNFCTSSLLYFHPLEADPICHVTGVIFVIIKVEHTFPSESICSNDVWTLCWGAGMKDCIKILPCSCSPKYWITVVYAQESFAVKENMHTL